MRGVVGASGKWWIAADGAGYLDGGWEFKRAIEKADRRCVCVEEDGSGGVGGAVEGVGGVSAGAGGDVGDGGEAVREKAPGSIMSSTKMRIAVGAVALLVCLFGFIRRSMVGQSKQNASPEFRGLSAEDTARMDKQREVVLAAAKKRFGNALLTRQKSDLAILQRLIDDQVFDRTQTYELQCLGVAFGDVLASEFPLKWVMVTDEYGTDPTLRYKMTSVQINALTMISKRIEKGERVTLSVLLKTTGEQLALYDNQSR
jgi:Domain of unknown function (DUF3806)